LFSCPAQALVRNLGYLGEASSKRRFPNGQLHFAVPIATWQF
jgi:hypothetical protein